MEQATSIDTNRWLKQDIHQFAWSKDEEELLTSGGDQAKLTEGINRYYEHGPSVDIV